MPITNYQREQFITSIRNDDYSFINPMSGSEVSIARYNEDRNSLIDRDLLIEGQSNTNKVLAIHRFYERQYRALIDIYVDYSRKTETAATAEERQKYLGFKVLVRKILKTAKQFRTWSLTILSLPTLNDQPSVISRTLSEQQPSLAMTYEAALDVVPVDEQSLIVEGKGISLNPRLQGEGLDPKHRAWGTQYGPIRNALGAINDTWVNNQAGKEDLTVEIEFDDRLRQLDQEFNPTLDRNALDFDSPAFFNSFNYYLSPKESLEFLLTTREGVLYRGRDKNTTLDTHGERHIFTMDMQGNFYSNQDGEYRDGCRIGHPSFTRGEVVAGAGEMKVHEGKITEITNLSGHYVPGPLSVHRVLNALESRAVLAENCRVCIIPPPGEREGFIGAVAEFKQQYPLPAEIQNPPDLSEKANPAGLLDSLKAINDYLKHRAGETNRILALFKSFNGKDFYDRSNHFSELMLVMQYQTREQVLKHIDDTLPQFQRGRRTTYANLLANLRDALTEDSLLTNRLVREYLVDYSNGYYTLNQQMSAQRAYYSKSFFSDRSTERGEIAASSAQYRFFRKNVSEERRSEFDKADAIAEITQHNAKNW